MWAQTIDSNVSLSHIALSLGAGVLFAGTEHGAIRAYQYPLTGMLLLHPLDTIRIKLYNLNIMTVLQNPDAYLKNMVIVVVESHVQLRLCYFCSYNVVENEAHFILEYPLYNSSIDRLPSLFQILVVGSLRSYFQLTY